MQLQVGAAGTHCPVSRGIIKYVVRAEVERTVVSCGECAGRERPHEVYVFRPDGVDGAATDGDTFKYRVDKIVARCPLDHVGHASTDPCGIGKSERERMRALVERARGERLDGGSC